MKCEDSETYNGQLQLTHQLRIRMRESLKDLLMDLGTRGSSHPLDRRAQAIRIV